jgi:hypothetical protein
MADKTPKRASNPKGQNYDPGMFHEVESEDDFARVLGVPKETIKLIVPCNKQCASDECPFVAIEGNREFCPVHRKGWYPKRDNRDARGIDWHGPSYLRWAKQGRVCDCGQQACIDAGYFPGQSAMEVSKEKRAYVINTICTTVRLFDDETMEKFRNDQNMRMYLYPWHFDPDPDKQHLVTKAGKYALNYSPGSKEDYYDEDGKKFSFPPPNYSVKKFIDEVLKPKTAPRDRWAESNMPAWLWEMLNIDDKLRIDNETSPRKRKADEEAQLSPYMKRRMQSSEARIDCLRNRLESTKNNNDAVLSRVNEQHKKQISKNNAQYEKEKMDAKKKYDTAMEELKQQYEKKLKEKEDELKEERVKTIVQQQTIAKMEGMISKFEEEYKANAIKMKELREANERGFRFIDLYEGGMLSGHVKQFTFFNTIKQNVAFLKALNYTDDWEGSFPEGDGLCENLRTPKDVGWDERAGRKEPPSLDINSPEYQAFLRRSKAARKKTGRTWKDDYLAYCMYLRSGATQEFVACLCGISSSRMSEILYEWTQVLDTSLQQWFRTPTRSEVLRAYPQRFFEADNHAMCFMLLDAVEIFAQQSSNPNVASTTHSDYKKHCTAKFLAACGVIGEIPAEWVPDGRGGKASDVMMTDHTNILKFVPFGHTCKVDKGFIVNLIAAREGVVIDRPQKRKKNQKQQSAVDTAQTQKIGNTRIIIENVNGGVKTDLRYLNALIPCHQFPIISQIVRIGFLLQNFKKPIIQHVNPDSKPDGNIPCRAEVRWGGAECPGLIDIRGHVHKWGLKDEIKRFAELQSMDRHKDKSKIEIGEMVLSECWDKKNLEELYELDHREYTGEKFRQDLYEEHGTVGNIN